MSTEPNFNIDFGIEFFEEQDYVPELGGERVENDATNDTLSISSSQELDNFVMSEKSKNTVKKTRIDWEKFKNFCFERTNNTFNIENIPLEELDKLLALFFKDVRTKDGEEYEPASLSSFQRSIQRYITEKKLQFNILKDDIFSRSRAVLAAKRKNLVKQGRGSKPNASREITDEEEATLFETGQFGCHNPVALQRTLWFYLSMHYGFRARDESRKLCWGDIKLEKDVESGRDMLMWTKERGTKTRQGVEGGHQRPFNPKLFATNTDKCPVSFFRIFESHRPEETKKPDSPFFLAVNHKSWRDTSIWYKKSPLGKNEIGKFMADAAKQAGLASKGKKLTNHSVRKTSISRLLDGGVPENFVAQLSGHKNIQSLSSYKSASNHHQKSMSDILSRTPDADGHSAIQPFQQQSTSRGIWQSQQSNQSANISGALGSLNGQTFFAGASIGSIENCVFKVYPSYPSAIENSDPKRPRRESPNILEDINRDFSL